MAKHNKNAIKDSTEIKLVKSGRHELEQRIEMAAFLMADNRRTNEIVNYFTSKYGVTQRTAYNYMEQAWIRMRKAVNINKYEEYAIQYLHQINDCIDIIRFEDAKTKRLPRKNMSHKEMLTLMTLHERRLLLVQQLPTVIDDDQKCDDKPAYKITISDKTIPQSMNEDE